MMHNQLEQERHVQARISRYQQEPHDWKQAKAARVNAPAGMTSFMTSLRTSFHATLRRLHLETRNTLETIKPESPICLPGEAC